MGASFFGMMLDVLVLVFLAATMLVAWRLSESIKIFRRTRADMDKLVQDLSRNVEKAEMAITGLKASTKDSGRELQALVSEAKALSDELQLMTESGDNLASRLERLAERNRDIVERIERAGGVSAGVPAQHTPLPRAREEKRVPTGPSFMIRDREVEQISPAENPIWDEDEDMADFQSRAERELLAALGTGPGT